MGYVEKAEKVIKERYFDQNGRPITSNMITTSKIRKLLSGMSDIYNDVIRVTGEELPEEIIERIQYLKIQFVYEYGRDKNNGPVRGFMDKSEIIRYIDKIGKSKSNFIKVERYMEALVAYHRFYGGKDE